MPDPAPHRKQVTFSPEAAGRIEDYRFGNRIGSESEAIRRLVEIGLDHAEAAEKARNGGADGVRQTPRPA